MAKQADAHNYSMSQDHANPQRAIRHEYERVGADAFYRTRGASYRNPHEHEIRRSLDVLVLDWKLDLSHVLDLAAGSGEVTIALRDLGAGKIEGIDPFTYEAYERRICAPAGRETFEEIAAGRLAGRTYSLIVCSFAMHLVEPSRLAQLAYQLSVLSKHLLIITPHKRPQLGPEWGWELTHEMVLHRVRSRLYRSVSIEM
jgi:methyltransferase family protein